MSTLGSRLDKVMPALTAKERAILALWSLKERTPEDPSWRRTMPADQAREFNRYIGLMNACNIYLPLYITMVEQQTEQVYLKLFWLQSMVQEGAYVWDIAKLVPASRRPKVEKIVANSFPPIDLPWVDMEGRSWLDVTEGLEDSVREGVLHRWEELRAIDIIVEEVAREFDGEDPLRPIMRGIVETTRKQLTILYKFLELFHALREPDDDLLDLVRTFLEKGTRTL